MGFREMTGLRSRVSVRKVCWLLALAAASMLLAACGHGAYAVEIFPEQHYQQSYKRQEPPRLTPPDGAVPVNGRPVDLSAGDSAALTSPVKRDRKTLAAGDDLFRVNCSMCHGAGGRGDGLVGGKLKEHGYATPPDLLNASTQGKSDGTLFWTISNGVVVMPPFKLLLTEEERWEVVNYLRYMREQQR